MRSEDLQRDLAASVDATLAVAAQRNEVRLAWMRAIHLTVGVVALLIFRQWPQLLGVAEVPVATCIAGVFWLFVSWSIVIVESRHGYRAWVPWATTAVDVAMIVTFRFVAQPVNAWFALAATAIISTLMTLMAALRLKRSWVWIATVIAATNLAFLAFDTALGIAPTLVLLILLFVAGLLASHLADVTREAVESEVRRVVLQRFLPKPVIDAGDHASLKVLTEPRSLDATVLISDLRSFTAFAEQLPPADVLALLNKVQGTFASIVKEHGGTVDKFMGDGMLAVFGAPDPASDHATRAVAAAESILDSVARLNATHDGAPIRVGVGVHSGRIVTGCLGSGARLEFTVIGDTVNIASRLEAMTKEKGVAALISNETLERADHPHARFESLGAVAIRGRVQPLNVHTLALKENLCTT